MAANATILDFWSEMILAIFDQPVPPLMDHYTLLHTKYVSSGSHGFREEDDWGFLSYIAKRIYKQMTPWGMASLGPRVLIGRIYVEKH